MAEKWIEVSVFQCADMKYFVNTDTVRYIMPYGNRTRIYFTNTEYITCTDDYEDLKRLLK